MHSSSLIATSFRDSKNRGLMDLIHKPGLRRGAPWTRGPYFVLSPYNVRNNETSAHLLESLTKPRERLLVTESIVGKLILSLQSFI